MNGRTRPIWLLVCPRLYRSTAGTLSEASGPSAMNNKPLFRNVSPQWHDRHGHERFNSCPSLIRRYNNNTPVLFKLIVIGSNCASHELVWSRIDIEPPGRLQRWVDPITRISYGFGLVLSSVQSFAPWGTRAISTGDALLTSGGISYPRWDGYTTLQGS